MGDGWGSRLDGEEGDRAIEESDDLLVAVVDGGEAERHVQREFDPVTIFPGAVEVRPGAGCEGGVDGVAIDREFGFAAGPRGIRKAIVKRSGCESVRCMLVSPLTGY